MAVPIATELHATAMAITARARSMRMEDVVIAWFLSNRHGRSGPVAANWRGNVEAMVVASVEIGVGTRFALNYHGSGSRYRTYTVRMTKVEGLALTLVGPIALARDGEAVPLPSSRKTRALLGYLAATGKPQRREHLTTLLWEVPDDPRGALRWSLSKLRPLVDEGEHCRLEADRESVHLDCTRLHVDWRELRDLAASDVRKQPLALLEDALRPEGEFMEGLDLPGCETFHAWLVAMREDTRRWQVILLRELVSRIDDPAQALAHARRWSALDPYDAIARTTLIDLLERAGRRVEADQQRTAAIRTLDEAELAVPSDLRTRAPAAAAATYPEPDAEPLPPQQVRFCAAKDGTGLAYSCVGDGPPLVKTANWLNHLEHDFDSPMWRHWIRHFTEYRQLVRYDERGNGLSDWNAREISFEAFVDDLASVVDAAGLDTFDLFGVSQGCSVAIAYSVRHPGRVRRLVLYGGYPTGWRVRASKEEIEVREAMIALTRVGWGRDIPAFRQLFTSLFFPDAAVGDMEWFNELQRLSASAENAIRLQEAFGLIDVREYLPQVAVPTLVLHTTEDCVVPFPAGRKLATSIPDAQFVALDSRNHLILEHEPAWKRAADAIRTFLE
jgi:pimeloyl-ACP methyl ester carboxylesterase/DNA-binding SARP family transcriptional activator